jgi:hypothetical protein
MPPSEKEQVHIKKLGSPSFSRLLFSAIAQLSGASLIGDKQATADTLNQENDG